MNTLNQEEISKFSKIADDWWNEDGEFKTLHKINPIRVKFITDFLREYTQDLSCLNLLDIGCGGGLVAEAMAREKINVTAIDVVDRNIELAKNHAAKNGLVINYRNITLENLIKTSSVKYDVILALEVVEHVDNFELFVNLCSKLLTKGSIIFFSTINRTLKSWMLAIVAAEYFLRLLPVNTHSWKKFINPSELVSALYQNNINVKKINGISYNIFQNEWSISKDISVNYILAAVK